MYGVDLLLTLPVEVACDVVGKWLSLKDVARLDSSLCLHASRRILLEDIFKSPLCVAAYSHSTPLDVKFIWAFQKGIRSESVYMTSSDNKSNSKEHLEQFGQCVRHVTIVEHSEATALIQKHCANVTTLICWDISCSPALVQLLATSAKLDEFMLTNNRNAPDDIEKLNHPVLLQKISLKSITLQMDEASEAAFLKWCVPECIQRLRVVGTSPAITWDRFINLRCLMLNFTLDEDSWWDEGEFIGPELPLLNILSSCPFIMHLSLSCEAVDNLSDDVFVPAISAMRALRTLNIAHAQELTDVSLHALVKHHKHALEALYIYGCIAMTTAATNHTLEECSKLHTLSYSFSGIELDGTLMGNLTTLITDFTEERAWTVSSHLHRLQNPHIVFPMFLEDLFTMGNVYKNLQRVIGAVCSQLALRTLYLVDACSENFAEIRAAVGHARSTVLVVKGETGDWLDLNRLSI